MNCHVITYYIAGNMNRTVAIYSIRSSTKTCTKYWTKQEKKLRNESSSMNYYYHLTARHAMVQCYISRFICSPSVNQFQANELSMV